MKLICNKNLITTKNIKFINKLETFFFKRNLFEKDKMIGTYTNNISVLSGQTYKCYTHEGEYNTGVITTDEEGNENSTGVISGVLGYTVPEGVKYIRFNTFGNNSIIDNCVVVEGTHCPSKNTNGTEPFVKSILNNKRWLVLGDSISTGNDLSNSNQYASTPYHVLMAQKYGMIVTNRATSGYTTYNLWNNTVSNFIDGEYEPDIITIFIGTNDCSYSADLKTPYRLILNKLKELYPNAKIGLICPIDRRDQHYNLPNYIQQVKDIANEYSLPYLDIYKKEGWDFTNADDVAKYTCGNDGLHPNDLGHELLTRKIEHFILRLFD